MSLIYFIILLSVTYNRMLIVKCHLTETVSVT